MPKTKRAKIDGQWHDTGEFWVTVDDGRDIVTVMLTSSEAIEFLVKANGGAAKLNAEGNLKAA